jgi:hypothetical protein
MSYERRPPACELSVWPRKQRKDSRVGRGLAVAQKTNEPFKLLAALGRQDDMTKLRPKRKARSVRRQSAPVSLSASPGLSREIRAWAKRQPDAPSIAEAVRRLVEIGLAASRPDKQRSKRSTTKASEMAGQQIDKFADASLPAAERLARKQRLLQGPQEFQELRGDQAKTKDCALSTRGRRRIGALRRSLWEPSPPAVMLSANSFFWLPLFGGIADIGFGA